MPLNHLFAPIRLGRMEVRNRLVMPPMSVNFGVDEQGFVTEQHWVYLALRAKAGTGMSVMGGGTVHPDGLDLPRMPRVWDDCYIPGLSRLTAEVKRYGARIGLQLLHGGRQAFHERRVAPSPLPSLAVVKGVPRELANGEIKELVVAHAEAARRARDAGFDFVEIHAAHGYLISEFLAPNANRRNDEYGGSFENRTRFLLEIVSAIKERCGRDYPLGVRYNGEDYVAEGWHLDEAVRGRQTGRFGPGDRRGPDQGPGDGRSAHCRGPCRSGGHGPRPPRGSGASGQGGSGAAERASTLYRLLSGLHPKRAGHERGDLCDEP